MRVRLDTCRPLVYRIGALKDANEDATVESSIAKLHVSDCLVKSSLDAVQIHGENVNIRDFPMAIKKIVIIKPVNANRLDVTSAAIEAAELFDSVLIDSSTNNKLGGTGKVHDWEISRKTAEAIKPKPLILAGGLHSGNVIEAINRVRPYAVDVCTGTESKPGKKDPKKINQFLSVVNKADRGCANTNLWRH